MTAVESSPAGRWGEAVESQFERLEARLLAEFGDGLIAGWTVRDLIAAARAHYVGARVWIYLPILIERDVRRQLQKPDAPEPRVPPERCPAAPLLTSRSTGCTGVPFTCSLLRGSVKEGSEMATVNTFVNTAVTTVRE